MMLHIENQVSAIMFLYFPWVLLAVQASTIGKKYKCFPKKKKSRQHLGEINNFHKNIPIQEINSYVPSTPKSNFVDRHPPS